MFVLEAIRLQWFTPTRYVKNGVYPSCTRTYNVDVLYPICSNSIVVSMLALYGSIMHVAILEGLRRL